MRAPAFVFLYAFCVSRLLFFFSSRRRHTRSKRDWSSDVCSSDLVGVGRAELLVDLVAADLGQVVALPVEEQVVEQRARRIRRRGLARTQLAVDVQDRKSVV